MLAEWSAGLLASRRRSFPACLIGNGKMRPADLCQGFLFWRSKPPAISVIRSYQKSGQSRLIIIEISRHNRKPRTSAAK
jgi:hypothetical protein